MEKNLLKWSIQLFLALAESKPKGRPISKAKKEEKSTNSRVAGNLLFNSLIIG